MINMYPLSLPLRLLRLLLLVQAVLGHQVLVEFTEVPAGVETFSAVEQLGGSLINQNVSQSSH